MRYLLSVLICILFISNAKAQVDFTGIKVMINPGHGGHDSDDRGMSNGFWESEGNLTKGLWLRDLLEARGCEVVMSRVLNRTEDDLPLSQIAEIANANEVDLFISIHSNAGSQTSNFPLMLYNGETGSPSVEGSDVISGLLYDYLISIESTHWTNYSKQVYGDRTFYGWQYGLGVLYPLTVTGFLSEGSFHDHEPEVWRLMNLDYRKQEAYHMMYAMEEYFQLGTEDLGNISGWVRDSLLIKKNYTTEGSPDRYEPLNNGTITLIETGEVYTIDSMQNGFFMFDSIVPGTYHISYDAPKYFADTVEVEVLAHKFTYSNYWMRADKTMPSEVIYTTPENDELINCFDPITLTFKMNMDSATTVDAFSIDPHVDGTFTWDEDYLNLTFQPSVPYNTNSSYTITLGASAEHMWGVPMGKVFAFGFNTDSRAKYSLMTVYPSSDNEVGPLPEFRLEFDAPILSSSLVGNVYISKLGDNETISTTGASITESEGKGYYEFKSSEVLDFGTEYQLTVTGDVQDQDGIPLINDTIVNFTVQTEPLDATIIDELESTSVWSTDYELTEALDASSLLYKWKKLKQSGSASLLMRYNFTAEDACFAISTNDLLEVSSGSIVGMWVYGDLSGNAFCIGDKSSEAFSEEIVIDFAGWKYITFSFETLPTRINSIQLRLKTENTSGDIYIDALGQAINTSSPIYTEAAFSVYPNPIINNTIQISGLESGEHTYSLKNMLGQEIQAGKITINESKHQLKINQQINSPLLLLTVDGETIKISLQ